MTKVATWLTGVMSSSSHVRKIAVSPDLYAGLEVIFGIQLCNHASPVATGQSWVSLHVFGVMNENEGSVFFARSVVKAPLETVPIGTSQALQSVRIGT